MNPVYRQFLEQFSEIATKTKNVSLDESRVASTQFMIKNRKAISIHDVTDQGIPGPDGNRIQLRIYTPVPDHNLPILIFFHGGGWVFGGLEEPDALCREISKLVNCIVVSVDYRLAPENPFPCALEDCYTATLWAHKNARLLGGDSSRIAVGGESAGGNLAAAVALMARDKGKFFLRYQLLLYPVMTNDLDKKVYSDSIDQTFITLDAMTFFWGSYLQKVEEKNNFYASPLKARTLSGLPEAYIVTAEFDPLCMEAVSYAKKLEECCVKVNCKRYMGAIHGFLSLPVEELPVKMEAIRDIQNSLIDAFKS